MVAKNQWRTRAARKLRAQILREQPTCQLRLPGCTGKADEVDHIIPRSQHPELALVRSNCRASCKTCNNKRSTTPVEALTPPPALTYFTHKNA